MPDFMFFFRAWYWYWKMFFHARPRSLVLAEPTCVEFPAHTSPGVHSPAVPEKPPERPEKARHIVLAEITIQVWRRCFVYSAFRLRDQREAPAHTAAQSKRRGITTATSTMVFLTCGRPRRKEISQEQSPVRSWAHAKYRKACPGLFKIKKFFFFFFKIFFKNGGDQNWDSLDFSVKPRKQQ